MKKKKTMKLTASALIASSYLAGCTFSPQDNEPEDIYGPPVIDELPEEEENETPEPAEETPVGEEDGSDFDPGENTAEPLYGPPSTDVRK